MYERKSLIPIEEVLPHVIFGSKSRKPQNYHVFDGVRINMTSQRYQLFKTKGVDCVTCGAQGKYFAIERGMSKNQPNKAGWHLNLYAINSDGKEVLMTKDHILPRSRGGADEVFNYQSMCSICNGAKGNKLESE